MRQKFAQGAIGNILQQKTVQSIGQRAIIFQCHQHPRQARLFDILQNILFHLGFFHVRCSGEHGFDVAIFVDQL